MSQIKMPDDVSFAPFAKRMNEEGLPSLFVRKFATYYRQLVDGQTGLIHERDIKPAGELPRLLDLEASYAERGESLVPKTVMIKLNGGLGTGMGLRAAKSLLPVKNGHRFLDIIAQQASGGGMRVMLMNSFATDGESLDVLTDNGLDNSDFPLSFLQHKEPKIRQDNLEPVDWPSDPQLEWCPPGHGDIYTALVTSGALDKLVNGGIEYAFVSNADNLGAIVDPAILGYFAANSLPFLMEVARRTEMDRKGGHLALTADGRFILRESAQCALEDESAFQDVDRYKYFNTNNLWLNLRVLQRMLREKVEGLALPLIRNQKTVDPRDPSSTPVYHLETAMGSAIGVIAGSAAIVVPRSRFAPVKHSNDLLAVRSDAYVLTDEFHVVPDCMRRHRDLVVNLDDRYYQFVSDLDRRFPHGAPSLFDCFHFRIVGDFRFGDEVVCRGEVELINKSSSPVTIPSGTILEG